jgi:hypothetical protein
MSKITSFIGYTLAIMATPLVLATFIGMPFWAGKLVSTTGLKVSPWYSGGNVVRIVDHGAYQTLIHQTVFDGLICERSKGFVQVDWTPLTALPETIEEDIDYNDDGQADFHIQLDAKTGQARLSAFNPRILGLGGTFKLKKAWAIRVSLSNAP